MRRRHQHDLVKQRKPPPRATGVPTAGGDTAFDQEDFASFATVPVTLLATAQKADQPQ